MLCFRNGVYGYLQMQVHSTYEPYDDCYRNHIKNSTYLKTCLVQRGTLKAKGSGYFIGRNLI